MEFRKTELNEIKRGKKKAFYDEKTIYSVLVSTEICHIAFNHNGKAIVQPINFGRMGNKLYLHGSYLNRMTNAIIETKEVCLNVMVLDAMKLTRSAFHHSVNYRSATIFGSVKELTENREKLIGLESIINHFIPNRWEHCRKPNIKELKATRVIEITIETASAKIADSPPTENKKDLKLDYWAGTIPVKTVYENPIPDEFMDDSISTPNHILEFVGIKSKNNAS